MFNSNVREAHLEEITLNDVDENAMEELLHYMYTGVIHGCASKSKCFQLAHCVLLVKCMEMLRFPNEILPLNLMDC